jgi:hypothetical protein
VRQELPLANAVSACTAGAQEACLLAMTLR